MDNAMPESRMLLRHVEKLTDLFENRIPFNAYLGVKVDTLEPGRCVLRLPWREEFIGDPRRRAIHGGITASVADAAGGLVCWMALENRGDSLSTIDIRVDYLRPGRPEDLFAEARLVRMGNRVGSAEMVMYSGALPEPGIPEPERRRQVIATARGVYNILRRE